MFPTWLKRRFTLEKQKDPTLSLRGFAKMLDCAPSAVSEFMSGKRKLTLRMANRIGEKLNLSNEENAELFQIVVMQAMTARVSRPSAQPHSEVEIPLPGPERFQKGDGAT